MTRRIFNAKISMLAIGAAVSVMLAGCGGSDAPAVASNQLYSQTNTTANTVVHMRRASTGAITVANSTATGGAGSNGLNAAGTAVAADSLTSQYAVTLSSDNSTLFAANAGDGSISAFSIDASSGNLTLLKKTATSGSFPNSLAYSHGYLYASFVNSNQVIGFQVNSDGSLTSVGAFALPASFKPTQVKASPNGAFLLVGGQSASIVTFPINSNGSLDTAVINTTSIPAVPFAGVFLNSSTYLTTDAATASLSSYTLNANGTLSAISASIPATGQGASCWLSITPNGKWAYVGNGSGTISVYAVSSTGVLTLTNATASNEGLAVAGDSWISPDGKYLYSAFLKDGSVIAYSINDATGAITKVGSKVQVTPANGTTSSSMQGLVGI
jgi:6-phosphogluconolactonase (cycloisomerase 2 family)